jgi:hypothetical protein
MKCKKCNAPLKKGVTKCPSCGANSKSIWKRVLAVVCAAVLLCTLVCAALYGFGVVDFGLKENNIKYRKSYTVSDRRAIRNADAVIATVGDYTLTNGELQIYYCIQAMEFITNYGDYLSYFGLDYKSPLDKQYFSEKDGITWQQKFMEGALETWYMYAVMKTAAENEGYVIGEELKQSLDQLDEKLEELALKNSYSSSQEMVASDFGGACIADAYLKYTRDYYFGIDYLGSKYDELAPTQKEIDDYFAENQSTLEESGIKKDAGKYVDVRHILIQPKSAEGKTTYTPEEWDACKASAQAILNQWLAGEATEKTFGALAVEHSEDPGSAFKGGLYTQVAKGDMVTEFDNWLFDQNRKTGDYGLVKTKFGYHIMYFVDIEDIWISEIRDIIAGKRVDAYIEEVKKSCPMEVNYKKIVLGKPALS